jgi:3-deoxy-D-manno-octulosonic-acid transferase
MGASANAVRVTGDPGVDSAASRALGADPGAAWLAPFLAEPAPTVVAGSTWPADEAVLVPALTRVRDTLAGLRLVVAPHEPDARHVPPLLRGLADAGWRCATLGQVETRGALEGVDAVVVDRVGVLAQLYTAGTLAYVGGGFGRAGLHSVLEPAAAGLPVLFGPRHANAPAAADLLAVGAARVVDDATSLATAVGAWLAPGGGASAARAARGYIEAHLGAAERSARALARLLPDP